jgi:hypothetical protein
LKSFLDLILTVGYLMDDSEASPVIGGGSLVQAVTP